MKHLNKHKFEKFYNENIDRIYRYVFFRVGKSKEVAEDLVSEIFMKALKAFDKYDPSVSTAAWIYRITQNHLANHYRDSKSNVDIEDVKLILVGEDGREQIKYHETVIKIEGALNELSSQDRKLVTLKHLEGYTYADMSKLLGKSANALKVATHRALKTLRSKLT